MLNNIICRFLNRITYFKNRTVKISRTFYGVRWKIPIINGLGYEYSYGNNTELWVFNFLKVLNSKKQINLFIDVGVNIGQTLIKIKSIQPNVEYIGFDPSIKCISYVQSLQSLNDLNNSTLLAVGISDTVGKLTLRGYSDTDTRASFSNAQIREDQATFFTTVPVFSLDFILKENQLNQLVVLKIDVEGHELSVLKGARELLKMANPIILFEVLPHHNIDEKINIANELYKFLIKNNYTIYNLEQNTYKLKKVKSLIDNEDNYSVTDFVAFSYNIHKELI